MEFLISQRIKKLRYALEGVSAWETALLARVHALDQRPSLDATTRQAIQPGVPEHTMAMADRTRSASRIRATTPRRGNIIGIKFHLHPGSQRLHGTIRQAQDAQAVRDLIVIQVTAVAPADPVHRASRDTVVGRAVQVIRRVIQAIRRAILVMVVVRAVEVRHRVIQEVAKEQPVLEHGTQVARVVPGPLIDRLPTEPADPPRTQEILDPAARLRTATGGVEDGNVTKYLIP